MRHLMASVVIAASVLLPASGVTFAADPHTSGTTGQPNQSCEDSGIGVPTNRPGKAFFSTGVTFNDGTQTTPAGTSTFHYAANGPHGPPPDVNGAAHAIPVRRSLLPAIATRAVIAGSCGRRGNETRIEQALSLSEAASALADDPPTLRSHSFLRNAGRRAMLRISAVATGVPVLIAGLTFARSDVSPVPRFLTASIERCLPPFHCRLGVV